MVKAKLVTGVLILTLGACSSQQQQNASNTVTDQYLATAVAAKVATIDADATTRVHASSNNGIVTLTGQVRNAQERLRYDSAAKSVNGVKAVRDELAMNPTAEGLRGHVSDAALTARVSAAIAGEAGLNAFHIAPSVHQGDVTLRGRVRTQAVHQTVLQTVRGVPGVKAITDQITVAR